jgi:hypothetical protein
MILSLKDQLCITKIELLKEEAYEIFDFVFEKKRKQENVQRQK